MVDVDQDKVPSEGEILIFAQGTGFYVKGTMLEVVRKLAEEDWPTFELTESGDKVIVRSSQVVALREGSRKQRGAIGFVQSQGSDHHS